MTFEAFLEDWLEKKLTNLPKALETSDQRVPVRIANITFGFDNPEIIVLMKQRGALVTKGTLQKVPEINEKID